MPDSHQELFESFLDRSMSEREKLAFAELLDSDPSVRGEFVRYVEESYALAVVSKEIRAEKQGPSSEGNSRLPLVSKSLLFIVGSCLIAAAALVPYFQFKERALNIEPATVGRVVTGNLLLGSTRVSPGELVPPGLAKADYQSATIQFDNGSPIALFPGAEAELRGIAELRLLRGRITGATGNGARELVVKTDDVTVTDLGTRFGMTVSGPGATEVHVLDGTVQLQGRYIKNRLLTEGNALRIGEDRQSEVISLGEELYGFEFQEPDLGPAGFVHFGFEDSSPPDFLDTGRGIENGPFPATPVRPDFPPFRASGRFGKGITFDENRRLRSEFPGIGGGQPRTVSVWLKVSEATGTMSLVGWGSRREAQRWEIVLKARRGGRILLTRTEISNGYVLGTKNLADGKWHHFVSVYLGGNQGGMEQRIRHYVDGELDPISYFKPNRQPIDTRTDASESFNLVIGRHVSRVGRVPFSGILDEVYIFDRALTPGEIRELYRRNQPPEGRSNES